jgi:hypothetical protein
MKDRKIRKFVKELRQGNLKEAKTCINEIILDKFNARKQELNTEIKI